MISLQAGYCSSTLCNTIIGSLVGRKCMLVCMLTMGSSLCDCVLMKVAYKNFSNGNSNPPKGCIKSGILALSLTGITFIVSFKHITLYGNFLFHFHRDNGKINCDASCTVTSNV